MEGDFFIDSDDNRLSEKYLDIPVISIYGDIDDLVGYDDGIMVLGSVFDQWAKTFKQEHNIELMDYIESLEGAERADFTVDYHVLANFSKNGREWERTVNLSLYEGGILETNETAGLRRRGKSSSVGPQKGFNLYFRKEYDNKYFNYDLFGTGVKVKRLTLRGSYSVLTDGFVCNLVNDRSMIPYNHETVTLFLEGEYWGTYVLSERWEEHFFKGHYGYDNVVIYKNEETEEEWMEEYNDFPEIINYAKEHDMTNESEYNYVISKIDTESLIDCYFTRIFFDDTDSAETYNMMAWKPLNGTIENNKWHWALYDLDALYADYTRNNLTEEIRSGRPGFLQHDLISSLIRNDGFQKELILNWTDMLNVNFNRNNTVQAFEEYSNRYVDFLVLNDIRFSGISKDDAEIQNADKIRNITEFLDKREDYVWEYIQKIFDLGNPEGIEIKAQSEDTEIVINSTTVQVGSDWRTLKYFPEYEITITSKNDNFDKWIIDVGGYGRNPITVL